MAAKPPKTDTPAAKGKPPVATATPAKVDTQAATAKSVVAAKAEPAKAPAATAAPVKAAAVKAEPVKAAPAKVEPVKVEPVTAQATKPVPAKPAVAKTVTAAPAPAPAPAPTAPVPPKPEPVAAKAPPAPAATVTAKLPPVVPAAVTTPNIITLNKEVTIMETTMKNAAEKTQTMLADMNERTKSAMAKSATMFADINEFNKGNVEAIVESSKIAAKGMETMGQGVADYTRKSFEGMTAMMKSFAAVKSPTEFMKLQSDYLRQSFDTLVAESSKSTESMLKLAGEVAQPISNRVAVAAEKLKIAA